MTASGISARARAALFVFGVLTLLAGLCVTIVPETSQAVITRMGEPVRVINRWRPGQLPGGGGGLVAHLPLVERVAWIDRGIVTLAIPEQPLRSADQRSLQVGSLATYRVYDPVRLVSRLGGGNDKAREQLRTLVAAELQQQLGGVDSARLLRPGSGGAAATARAAIDRQARAFGIQLIDLRLSGASLSGGELEQTIERMETGRAQLAETERENGQRRAQEIIAQAQADSARVLGAAAGLDPDFYDFFRAMRSYEMVFANPRDNGQSTIVLGPDSEYLRQFKGR